MPGYDPDHDEHVGHNHGGHDHGASEHHHHHAPPAGFYGAFAIGSALNVAFVVAEVVFGLRAHSVALLPDAAQSDWGSKCNNPHSSLIRFAQMLGRRRW